MSLLSRWHTTSYAPLPSGAEYGFRWGALSRQRGTGVGVDVGAGTLKIAQTRMTHEGPRLENYAVIPLPDQVLEEGAIRDPVGVGEILRSALREMGVSQTLISTCVSGPAVIMRYINLPKVGVEEMRSAMRFEAPQHLPIPDDELVYDFTPVSEATEVPEHQMAVFLAGTHKKLIDSSLAMARQGGMRPVAIELGCLAALRALEWIKLIPTKSPTTLVLLDIGEVDTQISVMRYGVPLLSRTIPTGVRHLRDAVADTLHFSAEEAEQALRQEGVQAGSEIWPAIAPWVNGLQENINRSIEFFLIQNRGAVIESIYLIGGGTMLPGFSDSLSAYLQTAMRTLPEAKQLNVQPVTLAGMDVNPAILPGVVKTGPLLITAIGLALGEGSAE